MRIVMMACILILCVGCADKVESFVLSSDGATDDEVDSPQDAERDESSSDLDAAEPDAKRDESSDDDIKLPDAEQDADMGASGVDFNPHWVLRDNSGGIVHADTLPFFGVRTSIDPLPELGGDLPQCFFVRYLGSTQMHGARYDLISGQMQSCYQEHVALADIPSTYYLDSSCSATPYSIVRAIIFYNVSGSMYGTWGPADSVQPASYYALQSDGSCVELSNSAFSFWGYKLVPAWLLDAFAFGPYTIDLEYN